MNNTDKYFNEKLSDIKKAPPIGAWHNIEKGIAAKAAKRRGFIYMSVAASMVILMMTGLFIYNKDDSGKKVSQDIENNGQPEVPIQKGLQLANNNVEEKHSELESDTKREVEKQTVIQKNSTSDTQKELLPKEKSEGKTEPVIKKVPVKTPQTIGPISPMDQSKEWVADNAQKLILDTIKVEPVNTEKQELLAENTNNTPKNDNDRFVEITLDIEENSTLASIEEDQPKLNLKKIKRAMNREWYKQKIKLGDVSQLALNRIKIGSN